MGTPSSEQVAGLLDARTRLSGQAHKTPVTTCTTLDRIAGCRAFLKCENQQRGGAFKFRGAYNTIAQLDDAQRNKGIVAYSSGNHAQATALAGGLFSAPVHLVMPEDVSRVKLEACRGYGARINLHPPTEGREQAVEKILAGNDYAFVPPFDHPHIVAGQGTAALELMETVDDLDCLVVPCGGGGLLSGCAIATRHLNPACKVIGVEPELGDDAVRSFHCGTLQTVKNCRSIADGTRTPSLGALNFSIIRELVDDMVAVSEEQIREAVAFLFYRAKIVVEPSGALPVAALLAGKIKQAGRTGVILSGGNIDGELMAGILRGEQAQGAC